MSKTLTLRLDDETYRVFKKVARAEKRSIANLVERLKRGSRDARERRGNFVE